METTISVQLKFAYSDATNRTIKFTGVNEDYLPDVKDKVKAINDGLEAGTLPAFAQTFVSKIGAPVTMISEAKIIQTTEEVIYSAN